MGRWSSVRVLLWVGMSSWSFTLGFRSRVSHRRTLWNRVRWGRMGFGCLGFSFAGWWSSIDWRWMRWSRVRRGVRRLRISLLLRSWMVCWSSLGFSFRSLWGFWGFGCLRSLRSRITVLLATFGRLSFRAGLSIRLLRRCVTVRLLRCSVTVRFLRRLVTI